MNLERPTCTAFAPIDRQRGRTTGHGVCQLTKSLELLAPAAPGSFMIGESSFGQLK